MAKKLGDASIYCAGRAASPLSHPSKSALIRAVTLTTERNLKRLACQSLSCSRPCDGRCRDGRTGGRELIRSNNNTSQRKTQETTRKIREQAHHQQQETEEARRGVLACGGVSAILCLGARVAPVSVAAWLVRGLEKQSTERLLPPQQANEGGVLGPKQFQGPGIRHRNTSLRETKITLLEPYLPSSTS